MRTPGLCDPVASAKDVSVPQVEGVEMLARMLHTDAVQQRCPEGAVLKLALQGGQRCRQRLVPNYFLPFQ